MRILIVDDNEANRRILRVVLSAHGHSVVESVNGLEALAVLENSTFDALISDVLMPGMDGYRLCAAVRRSERSRSLPIVVYSSIYTSPADEEVALRAGADRFLPRPASAKALLDAMDEACGAPRSPVVPPGPALCRSATNWIAPAKASSRSSGGRPRTSSRRRRASPRETSGCGGRTRRSKKTSRRSSTSPFTTP